MELFEQIWSALRSSTLPDLGVWSYLILFILVFVFQRRIVAGLTAGAVKG